MALTQVSTDGIKNSTISSADLGSNLKVTGSLFEVENTGGNANFEVTRVSGANFRIQSQASSVRLDTIGASHPILLGTNGNGRIRINDSTVDLINDNQRLRIGAGNDLQIYHDGSNSYIQNSTLSSLYINSASHIYLANADNSEFKAKFHNNSSVELYHDGSKKFETTSGGVDVTGSLSVANHITIPDQASGVGKLKLGDGVDFQLYHNGSHSVIENRTGNLIFYITSTGEVAAKFIPNGAVELYHDNSKKFETTSTGATLTGTLLATTIDIPDSGYLRLGTGDDLQIYHNGSGSFIDAYTTDLEIRNSNTELMAEFRLNNAVDLYYDGTKRLSTHSQGAIVNGHTLYIRGASGEDARLFFIANDSASYNDHYSLNVAATGAFAIQTEVNANQFENLITATQNGNVELYYDNSKKFETTSAGVTVSGDLTFSDSAANDIHLRGGKIYGDDGALPAFTIQNTSGNSNHSKIVIGDNFGNDNGGITFYGAGSSTTDVKLRIRGTTDTVEISDNHKFVCGDGSDLQIFHDGSHSNINNATGNLRLQCDALRVNSQDNNESIIRADKDGAVELYHDNFLRLSTETNGITVTSEGNTPVVQWEGASNNAVGKIDCDQVSPTTSHMRFYTENNGGLGERVRLKHNNAIMINCTSNPTINAEGYVNLIVDNGRDGFNIRHNHSGNCVNLWRANGDGGLIHFYRGNSSQNAVGSISVNSSSTNYGSGSDYRLKENVTPISDGITRLKTLKPSRFNFIADPETTVDGFLAHEVTAVPEAIIGTKDEVDSKGNPVYQCIDQSKIVPLLVAAVQELIAKVEILEAG